MTDVSKAVDFRSKSGDSEAPSNCMPKIEQSNFDRSFDVASEEMPNSLSDANETDQYHQSHELDPIAHLKEDDRFAIQSNDHKMDALEFMPPKRKNNTGEIALTGLLDLVSTEPVALASPLSIIDQYEDTTNSRKRLRMKLGRSQATFDDYITVSN